MKQQRVFYGWIMVLAVHLVLFTIFSVAYSFSSFFGALQAQFAASRAGISFAFALSITLMFLIGLPAGLIADRTHVRWVVAFGIVAMALGLYASSLAQSLTQLYVSYGAAIGFGVGFAYVSSIAAVQPWFVKRRALAAGIASSGIGLGTLVGPVVSAALVDGLGWRASMQVLAVAALLLGLPCALLLEKSPMSKGLHPDNEPQAVAVNLATGGMEWSQAINSRTFRLFIAALAMTGLIQFMPFVHLARHAIDRGLCAQTGALLLGLIGFGSFAGRAFLTGMADRFGGRNSLAAMFLLMGLSFAWWLIALARPSSVLALALFALLFGLGYGGYVGLVPPLVMGYFGGKNLSGLIGLLYLAPGVCTLFAPTFAGWVYDRSGSYAWPIASGIAANAMAAWLTMRLPEKS